VDGVDDSERDPISFSMVLDGKIAVSSVVWLSMIFENSRTHVGQTSRMLLHARAYWTRLIFSEALENNHGQCALVFCRMVQDSSPYITSSFSAETSSSLPNICIAQNISHTVVSSLRFCPSMASV